jgi:hypothetical protein
MTLVSKQPHMKFPNFMTVGGNVKVWASQHGKIKEKGWCRYDIFKKYYLKASWDWYKFILRNK